MSYAITSIGMLTSVGKDAVTACAAIRAGLSMPSEIPYLHTIDEDHANKAVIGHPIRACTEGFVVVGRWLRLACGAVSDAVLQGSLPDGQDARFWGATGLIAVTACFDGERFGDDLSVELTGAAVRDAYMGRLQKLVGLPFDGSRLQLVGLGHAGMAAAAKLAEKWIAEGLERVLVVAADSYLDPFSLEWLSSLGRLRSEDNPCGVSPGEAGACLLLESEASARRRGAEPLALIDGAGLVAEKEVDLPTRAGPALATALGESLLPLGAASFCGDVISDQNGESWKAAAWAHARVKLSTRIGPEIKLRLPCTSIGDVGAASGAVGACLAARSFLRGDARSNRALVVSLAEHGHAGSLLVGARR